MTPKRAIILAAGYGSRMGALTADRPKALLEIDGWSLIDRQLDALHHCGIDAVTLVVGYQQQRLRDHLRDRVTFVENVRYRETNSLYSLWLARETLTRGALVMNADVVMAPELVERLVWAPAHDAVLVDDSARVLGEEEMKVRLRHGFVIDFSKQLAPSDAHGENVGAVKFGAEGAARLVQHLDAQVASGKVQAWAPQAYRALAQEWPLRAVSTAGLPWTEIDFPEDLERARFEVVPAIVRTRGRGVA
jgi:choline kinase